MLLAAARGDAAEIGRLAASRQNVNVRNDSSKRARRSTTSTTWAEPR
jgi:hypothetical protein